MSEASRTLNSVLNKYIEKPTVVDQKVQQLSTTADNKKLQLGIETEQDQLIRQLETSLQQYSPDYLTDENALISAEDATDGGIGQAINAVGGGIDAVANLAGDVLKMPAFLQDLYNKGEKATADGVNALLNYASPGLADKVNNNDISKSIMSAKAALGYGVNKVVKGFEQSGNIVEGVTDPLYNNVNSSRLAAEFGKDYDAADGFWDGFKRMAETAVENPEVAAETFVTSLPEMYALAKKGVPGAGAVISIVGDRYDETEKEFVKKHGREPDIAETAYMLTTSLASVAIDKFESRFILGKEVIDKATNNPAAKKLLEASKKIADSKIGKAVDAVPFGKTAVKATAGGLTETAQEGSQEALKELGAAQTIDTFADPETQKNIYVAGGMGMGAGAVGAGGVQAVKDTKETLTNTKQTATKLATDATTKAKDRLNTALNEGTPEEVLDNLSKMDLSTATPGERLNSITAMDKALDELTAKVNALPEGEDKVTKQAELEQHNTTLVNMIESLQRIDDQEKGINVQADIASIIQPDEQATIDVPATIERILGSAQVDSVLTEDVTERLLGSKLFLEQATPEQKTKIEAINAEHKTSAQVSSNILEGDQEGQFKGTNQYLSDIRAAVVTENSDKADIALTGIRSLLDRQKTKLAGIQAGIDSVTDPETGRITGKTEVTVLGRKWQIGPQTQSLVNSIQTDIKHLQAADTKATEMYSKAFGTPVAETAPAKPAKPDAVEATQVPDIRNKPISELTLEEAKQRLRTSKKSVLLNEDAYNEAPRKKHQLFMDIDDFKAINSQLTYDGADKVLEVLGQVMAEEADTDTIPYHFHGDEYLGESDNDTNLADFGKRVQERMRNLEITFTLPDGSVIVKKGIGISYGIGSDKATAEHNLHGDKERRKQTGERSGDRVNTGRRVASGESEEVLGQPATGNKVDGNKGTTEKVKPANPNKGKAGLIKAIGILKSLDAGVFPEKSQSLLARVIDTLEVALRSGSISDAIVTNFRTAYKKLTDEYAELTNKYVGIADAVLKNGITDTKQKSTDYLTVKSSIPPGLLNKIPNLITNFWKDTVQNVLPTVEEANATAVKDMVAFTKQFIATITGDAKTPPLLNLLNKKTIVPSGANSIGDLDQDPFGFLIQVDSTGTRYLDENLLSTIALVTYNWLGTQGSKTLFNNKEAINAILGRSSSHDIDQSEFNALADAGIVRNALAESLGKEIYRHLGLQAKKGIDGTFEDRLKMSLGELAVTVLLEQGLAEQTALDMGDFYTETEGLFEKNLKTNFIRIKAAPATRKVEAPKPVEAIDSIIKGMAVVKPVLNVILELPEYTSKPSFSVPTKVVTYLKNTKQRIPKVTRATIKFMQQTPFVVKDNITQVMDFMGQEGMLELLGYNSDIEGTTHITQHKSEKGKNLGIEQDLHHVTEFLAENTEQRNKPFYFAYEVYKNNRIGIVSNTINPQSSKLHRHLIGAQNWQVTIPAAGTKEAAAARTQFAYAVSLAFGGKVDATPGQVSLDHFDTLQDLLVVKAGVAAIKALQAGDAINPEQKALYQADIKAAVAFGGEAMHTLDALVALAAYHPTQAFETNLANESDGKTSGVIIGTMQSMVEDEWKGILAAGGIFVDGITSDYGTWKSDPTNRDSYERLAAKWQEILADMDDPTTQAVNSLMGPMVDTKGIVTKLGRDLSKNPLMITNYGAAVKRVVEEFSNKVLETFYADMVKNKDNLEYLKALQDKVNTVLGAAGPVTVHPGKDALESTLSAQQERVFKEAVTATYGTALEEAINAQFGKFTEFRSTVNNALNIMFKVFNHYYKENVIAKTKEVGRSLYNEEREEIAQNLQHLMPIFKGPLSEGIEDGILSIKTELQRQYTPAYHVQQSYTRGIPTTLNSKGEPSKSVTGHTSLRTYADGGVGGLILAIQSIDSAVIQKVLDKYLILNMYDAQINDLNNIEEGTKAYNQAFWDVNKNYNIIEVVQEAYMNVIKELRKDDKSFKLINKDVEGDKKTGTGSINTFTADLQRMVDSVNAGRKQIYSSITPVTVIQGAFPGAGVTIDTTHLTTEEEFEKFVSDTLDKIIKLSPDRALNSAGEAIDFNAFASVAGQPVTSDNTVQVFDSLAAIGNVVDTPTQTTYLRSLLTDLVAGALAPLNELELKVRQAGTETVGAIKKSTVYLKAAVGVIGNSIQMSAQETYAHELVHAITRTAIDDNYNLRRAIQVIYDEAKKVITVEDFLAKDAQGNVIVAVDPAAELAAAKARYDYIFQNTSVTRGTKIDSRTGHIIHENRNNYLHEFVAFGLTNEKFREKLATIKATPNRDTQHGTILERLEAFYHKVLDYISGKIHGTTGLNADAALRKLVEEMVDIHESKRGLLRSTLEVFDGIDDTFVALLNSKVFQPFLTYRNRNKNAASVPGRALNTIIGLPNTLSSKKFHKDVKTVSRNLGITEKNLATKLVREGIGATDKNIKWHTLLRFSKKYIDQARKHLSDQITAEIVNSFHTRLTKLESHAVNMVLLKTDLVSLVDRFNMQEISDLLTNPVKLNRAINALKRDLHAYGDTGNYYINQARGLGLLMAQGKTTAHGQMLNAYRIATLNGVVTRDTITTDTSTQEELIDALATLYALDATHTDNKNIVAKVIEREYSSNPDENGIIHTLGLHQVFKEEALNDLFGGNKNLMIKGYTQETFNPAVTVKMVSILPDPDKQAAQLNELNAAGFVKYGDPLPKDPKDPTGAKQVLYVSKDALVTSHVKGIASLTAQKVKGFTIEEAYYSQGKAGANVEAIIATQTIKAREERLVEVQFGNSDVTQAGSTNILVPIANDQGDTVGYRYMMSEEFKQRVLEKDNQFERVMGRMFGGMVDKVNTKQVNERLIKLAHEDFLERYTADPAGYVEISAKSKDPELKEIYDLLPKEAKADIKKIFGKDKMWVPAEMVDLIFGFHKGSMVDALNHPWIPDLIRVFAGKTKLIHIAKTFENLWQEVVKYAKDNIVVKVGVTLRDNVISNTILLKVKGVPMQDVFKHQALALRALNDFMGVVKERDGLRRKLQIYTNLSAAEVKQIEARIARLEDDITTNPVKELIDEGIFQTISEDIDLEEDIYSTKQRLLNKFQPYIDKVPPTLLTGYKYGYMTHDTPMYKLLLRGTQYSDFIARFTLYQYNLNNKKMNREAALADIIETFINYDVPTSKFMQYMNDMGVLMFTKFLFRIQKVIFKSFKEKPATNLAVYSLQKMFGEISDIPDSDLITTSVMGRINSLAEIVDSATYAAGVDHVESILDVFTE